MPWRRASAAAFPGVGEATATTSASSGTAFADAATQSAWNREPMIPTFTLVMAGLPRNFRDRRYSARIAIIGATFVARRAGA
jgi:hypothetical protein